MLDHGVPRTAGCDALPVGAALDLPAVIHEHSAAVYRYAYRLCGCAAEAEDLTQQTFLIAHQRLSQLHDAERVRGWLLAVVRSCFLKSVRRRRPVSADDLEIDLAQVAEKAAPWRALDRQELNAALAQLSDEFRLVLLMFYFEELSYHEIAQQLELPIGTIMSRLSRAKRHLRNKLLPPPETETKQPPARLGVRGKVGRSTAPSYGPPYPATATRN